MGDVTILVSPAEPKQLRTLGTSSFAVEEYGADFLIVGEAGIVGLQRKEFPGDFLSSVTDGRLHTVVMRLTATTLPIVLLEGSPQWTQDGGLLNAYGPDMKRSTLRAMEWSLFVAGIRVQWSDDLDDTADYIRSLAKWWAKDTHTGFSTRPGPGREDEFGRPKAPREWGMHVLQGFDGIGPSLAGRIYDKFNRIPLRWDVTKGELSDVHGLGPKKLDALTSVIGVKEEHDDED
jgi:ERCC4-type nuclease